MVIIASSVTTAFALGIQTAGDFATVESTQADASQYTGDFNGNGNLDVQDARIALELAQGFRTPTPDDLSADPNNDFVITFDDVLSILERLERAPSTPKVNL